MIQTAIHVESLCKRYRIGERERYLSLRDAIVRKATSPFRRKRRSRSEMMWALRDVSFDVERGEVIGLIGRNGAGKTTLLKVLSRITKPTSGFAELHGRVGSLLEVGTGFHPELTGRENVYLSGTILGMAKREIDCKFDEIVAFAEVEQFLDTALKHFSTGMQMRLAFAVAAHLEPEILFVDEVLAVGDINFQRKCLGKMQEVSKTGRTIIFVSHQMNQIRRLCEKVMWMDGGTIRRMGLTGELVGAYEAAMTSGAQSYEADRGQKVRFLRWEIVEPRANSPHMLTSLGPVTVRFVIQTNQSVQHGHHGVALFSVDRQLIWAWAKDDICLEPGVYSFAYTFPILPLRPGAYAWQVSLWEDDHLLDLWDCLPELNIAAQVFQHPKDEWNGILNVPSEFSICEGEGKPIEARTSF